MGFLQRLLARLLARKPEQPLDGVYALAQEAYAHLQTQQFDLARTPLLRAIGLRATIGDPVLVAYLLDALETTWLLTERYDDAIAFFSSHIASYPQDSEAHRGRGAALWYLGRLQDAIPDYTRALDLKPNDCLSLSGRGQVLAESGHYAKALEDLDLALRVLPTAAGGGPAWTAWRAHIEAFTRNGRGLALSGLGDAAAAMREFDQSIALSPDNAWVFHNRALAYERAGDLQRARADYQQSLIKAEPALSPAQREKAKARLRELPESS